MWRCCLNPKVISGLAGVGLLSWLFLPGSGLAAVPVLFALVCPLSMGAMAWRMRRVGGCAASAATAGRGGRAGAGATDVDAELAALREELAIVRARRHLTLPEDGSRQDDQTG